MAIWEYRGYRLGRRDGQWCATWSGDQRQRYKLGVRVSDGVSVGRTALTAFVHKREALVQTAGTGRTIGELFEAYIKDRQAEGVQIDNFHDSWKRLKPTFENVPAAGDLTELCRDTYAVDRQGMGVSRATIWTELNRLRSCMNWAAKRKLIPDAPFIWVPSKGQPRQRVLTHKEVDRLVDAAVNPHVKLFIILCICTGGRSGAVLELTWDRVNFTEEWIDLRLEDSGDRDITFKGYKKGRARVHMSDYAKAILLEHYNWRISGHVIEWNGEPCKSIKKAFRSTVKRAGLENVTPHTLRHTIASWCEDEGVDLRQVSRFLGHKQLDTTHEIYAKPDVRATRDAAEVGNRSLRLRVVSERNG